MNENQLAYAENKLYEVIITDEWKVRIIHRAENKTIDLKLFHAGFQNLSIDWDIIPMTYITPDSKYIIITYGIGFIIILDPFSGVVVKEFKLFPEICYEDDSLDEIDMGQYYESRTTAKFSPSGRYAVIRVRGYIDPQGVTEDNAYTPVYYRSFYLMDMENLDICFHDDMEDIEESKAHSRNVAVVEFSPCEKWLIVGAIGNVIALYDIEAKKRTDISSSLCWISDPQEIVDCRLLTFIGENEIVSANNDKDIEDIMIDECGKMSTSRVIKTHIRDYDHKISDDIYDRWTDVKSLSYKDSIVTCEYRVSNEKYRLFWHRCGSITSTFPYADREKPPLRILRFGNGIFRSEQYRMTM